MVLKHIVATGAGELLGRCHDGKLLLTHAKGIINSTANNNREIYSWCGKGEINAA